MNNEEEAVEAVWDAINSFADGPKNRLDPTDEQDAIVRSLSLYRLCIQAQTMANMEAGIRGTGGVWPSWVYEARAAIKCRDESIPWLNLLLDALGWQGGTIHDALNCVSRLVASAGDSRCE